MSFVDRQDELTYVVLSTLFSLALVNLSLDFAILGLVDDSLLSITEELFDVYGC